MPIGLNHQQKFLLSLGATWEQVQVAHDVDHGGSAFFATTVSIADLA
jgi:hypothetical protein